MSVIQSPDFELMSPKVDFAFKEIMMDEKSRTGFLSAVLGIPEERVIIPQEKNPMLFRSVRAMSAFRPTHPNAKLGDANYDTAFILADDSSIGIQTRIVPASNLIRQSMIDVAHRFIHQTPGHAVTKKSISICILDFPFIEETNHFHSIYHVCEQSNHFQLSDAMEWHIIELSKLPMESDGTILYQWARFLSAERRDEFETLAKTDEYLASAFSRLDEISKDERMREEYLARISILMNYDAGKAEGRAQTISELTASMRAAGLTQEQITQILKGAKSHT